MRFGLSLRTSANADVAEDAREAERLGIELVTGVRVDEHAEARPGMIAGPPDQVAKELAELGEMGVTSLIVWAAGNQAEQRDRLATEVVPQLRG